MNGIIEAIENEISKLREARAILVSVPDVETVLKRRGRPPASASKAPQTPKPKRVLSPEAKAKIAAAQKKRWAAAKKAA